MIPAALTLLGAPGFKHREVRVDMLTYPYDPEGIEQEIKHIVMSAPCVPHAKLDHDIDTLGHRLDMPGLKKEIWAIIKADRFLTDEETQFKIWDLVSRVCSA